MLYYLLFCAFVIGSGYALHHFWQKKIRAELDVGASHEAERLRRADAALMDGVSDEDFRQHYTSANLPRFPGYLLATVAAFLIGTPVLLGLLNAIAYYAGRWGLVPQPGEVATDLYLGSGDASIIRKSDPETLSYIVQGFSGFYYFFGLLGFWILVVYLVMRRYHKKAPGSVDEEIRRNK